MLPSRFVLPRAASSDSHRRSLQAAELAAGKEVVHGISLQGQMQLVAFCVFEVGGVWLGGTV